MDKLDLTYMLMKKENHNDYYDYFLTDTALEYQEQSYTTSINKGTIQG